MARKQALKRLTASDLTFFEWHFRNRPAGNQKAINLNADVFVDQLYPALPEIARDRGGRIPIDLYLYGPGSNGLYNLQRKIIKFGSYKNWRLDGEFIHNPVDSPERFNPLQPDDLVILDFDGDPVYPNSLKAFFLARAVPDDAVLYSHFETFLGRFKMASITPAEARKLMNAAAPPDDHPIYELILDEVLEDAALHGVSAIRRLARRPASVRISKEALTKARKNADDIGRLGEEFVNSYFLTLKTRGELASFEWSSEINAIAPYDFCATYRGSARVLVEVKSTSSTFERQIHLSAAELYKMADHAEDYHLYRVFEMDDRRAKLRIAPVSRDFAQNIIKVFAGLPAGVLPDSISFSPELLEFGPPIDIEFSEVPEEE
ncbi:MAG: protein NO VEIN domain-containing protein [Syntrophobacteraceae bacterium]